MSRLAVVLLAAVLSAAALAPAPAAAQNLTVAVPAVPPGGAAPLVNGVVMGGASSIYLTVTNGRAGTTVNEIAFEGNQFDTIIGGLAPAGWSVTDMSTTGQRTYVTFRVAACGTGGLANGQSGIFRIDFDVPASSADTTMSFRSITPSDPCGGPTGWPNVTSPSFPDRSLSITAAVAPNAGGSPLSTTVTYTVTNLSSTARTVSMALPTISPAGGTASACTPASRALAARGGAGSFTCAVTLTAATPTLFTIASNASGTGASGVGAAATAMVGPATASFSFDELGAANGQIVRATLSVTNDAGTTISVTPPAYSALTLAALAPASGAVDPGRRRRRSRPAAPPASPTRSR